MMNFLKGVHMNLKLCNEDGMTMLIYVDSIQTEIKGVEQVSLFYQRTHISLFFTIMVVNIL